MEHYDDDIPSNKVIELVLRRIIAHLLTVAKDTLKWENILFRIFFDKFPSQEFTTSTVTAVDMTVDRIYKQLNDHLQSNDDILLDGQWSGNMVVSRLVLDKRKKKKLIREQNNNNDNDVNLGGRGSKEKAFVNNLGITNVNVDINCLAHAVLINMSMIEKGDLYRAILAGFDRYLKMIVKDQLIEIEKSCQVDVKQGMPIYSMNQLHENYLREKDYHLCVYTENDNVQDKVLLYDSTRKNGQIMDLSDKKLILMHKDNHFDIITNLELFLYRRKVAYCVKCMTSMQDQLNHVCHTCNHCVICVHIHELSKPNYDSKCSLCGLFFMMKNVYIIIICRLIKWVILNEHCWHVKFIFIVKNVIRFVGDFIM